MSEVLFLHLRLLNAEIDFAHRTFKWHNEAKGNAYWHYDIRTKTGNLTKEGMRNRHWWQW